MKLGSLGGIAGGDIMSGIMDNLAYRVDSVVNMVTLEGGFHNLSGPLDRRMELVKRRRKAFGLPMPMLEGGMPLLHGGGNGSVPSTVDRQRKQSLLNRGGKDGTIARKLREDRQRLQEQRGKLGQEKESSLISSLYEKYHLR